MAVRSIFEIDVNDSAFKRFQATFKQYQDALAKTPGTWDQVTKSIDGSRKSFDALVAAQKTRLTQAKLISDAEKVAEDQLKREASLSERMESAWASMAKNAKSFAGGIADATKSLLQWASITGLISGIIGTGGLLGIDRLALNVSNQRRTGLGLGVTPGQQQSFGLNFGRVLSSPESLLGGVNEALTDVRKSTPFATLGLNYGAEQAKGTYGASVDVLRALKALADRTPEAQAGTTFDAKRLGDLGISPQDFLALKRTSKDEIDRYIKQAQEDQILLDLTKEQLRVWQDLSVTLDRAGRMITKIFVDNLTPLTPSLDRLSKSFVSLADHLLEKDGPIQHFIETLADGLDWLSKEMDDPKFQKDVDDFISALGKLGPAVASAVEWFAGLFGASPNGKAPPSAQDDEQKKAIDTYNKNKKSMDAFFERLRNFDSWGAPKGAGPWGLPPSATPQSYDGSPMQATPASFRTMLGTGTSSREQEAHDFFRAAGYNENQTAGLLANARAESGFDPSAFNPAGGGQGAQGIFQWRGDRVAQFQKLFGHSLRNSTYEEQLMFAAWELQNTEKAAGDKLRAYGKSASGSAAIVNQEYERSGSSDGLRSSLAEQYAHIYRAQPSRIKVENATGGNAVITTSQLAVSA